MPSKRILVLTNRVPYPLNDGGNLAMNAMIEGYARLGWEVYLLSMNTTRHYISESIQKKVYQNLYQFETVDIDNSVSAVQLLKNFFFSNQPNHADRFYKEHFKNRLKEVIEDFVPDVIQIESVFLTTYINDINSNAFTILRLHNIESQIWSRLAKESNNLLKKLYFSNLANRIKVFEERAWSTFDMLLPITPVDAAVVSKTIVREKLCVAPYGIESIKPSENSQENWVGYHIGAMDWQPNIEGVKWFIEDVWQKVQVMCPEFKFYFAGRNMPESLSDMGKKHIYNEGVVPDANNFIVDKKILIVPIHSGGGIRVKVLEAMAMGKVVISTSVGIQGVDAQPGIHFLLANKSDEFVNAINWCLNNKDKADEIAINAIELVKEKYISDNIMNKINDKILSTIE